MKKIVLFTGLLISIGAISISEDNVIFAASGCCKEYTDNGWRIYGRDYDQCQELNRRHDSEDDIYSDTGKFWWDSNCQ